MGAVLAAVVVEVTRAEDDYPWSWFLHEGVWWLALPHEPPPPVFPSLQLLACDVLEARHVATFAEDRDRDFHFQPRGYPGQDSG